MWPPSITASRSDIVSASSWSWVTYTNVMPTSSLQRGQVVLQLLAQLGVERAERLVEQQHRRLQDQRPGQRHALLLAARQLRRPPLLEPAEAHELDRPPDAALALGASEPVAVAPPPQAVGDVVGDAEVREQRVRLEHRVDRPAVRAACRRGRRRRGGCCPLGRLLEAADHPQRRGLAAARRPEQREELTGLDHEVDVVDGDEIAELLAQRGELDPTAVTSGRRDLVRLVIDARLADAVAEAQSTD